jgi:hypothetical protein
MVDNMGNIYKRIDQINSVNEAIEKMKQELNSATENLIYDIIDIKRFDLLSVNLKRINRERYYINREK